MKAIVYRQYGPPEVLHLEEAAKPAPKDGEVLIRVHAAPVEFGDLTARNFANLSSAEFHMLSLFRLMAWLDFGLRAPRKPILGSAFAGEIESVGRSVKKFKPGDKVYGYRGPSMGAYAEYLCMPEAGVVALRPGNMSCAEACAVPYGGIMALQHLRLADIRPGQKVLILGASGGIGSRAVQLAKHFGAEVTGVCGGLRAEYVAALGADKVIDYTREDFTRNGEQYDLIYDVLGKGDFSRCRDSLTESGIYLMASFKMRHVFQMLRNPRGGGRRIVCALAGESPADLDVLRRLAEAGNMKSIIDRRFPLEQAADAHRYAESGGRRGSIVLTMEDGEQHSPRRRIGAGMN